MAITTQTLRSKLFTTIDQLMDGKMDPSTGSQIAKVSNAIIATAKLEIEHAKVQSKIDEEGTGIDIGPLLLGND